MNFSSRNLPVPPMSGPSPFFTVNTPSPALPGSPAFIEFSPRPIPTEQVSLPLGKLHNH
jgi:hypothetical protein